MSEILSTLSREHIMAGFRLVQSEAALIPPRAARTDDMRAMVDDLERHGQINLRPGAYAMGRNTIVIHPQVYRVLQQRAVDHRTRALQRHETAVRGGRA